MGPVFQSCIRQLPHDVLDVGRVPKVDAGTGGFVVAAPDADVGARAARLQQEGVAVVPEEETCRGDKSAK